MDVRSPVWTALRERFTGEIVLPGDDGYDAARAVWNGMIDRRPAAVVRPASQPDVITAVRFAREQDLRIAVRGGGHSIPGFSTCDDGIVIDLSRMRGVTVDPERRLARASGGALLGELDDAAQKHGLVCPVGVVSNTGVAGLTLGGGMGRLQRKFGLTIDSLRSVELVTADGRVVEADDGEHAELFWGMRGAGANFGIATSFKFELHPLDPTVTQGSVIHPIERALEAAALFRDLSETLPNDVALTFGMGLALPADQYPPEIAGKPIVVMSVLHCGSPDVAESALSSLRSFGPPVVDGIGVKTYSETQHLFDSFAQWGHRFSMSSMFLSSLPDAAVASLVDRIAGGPAGVECSYSTWLWGGAIADVGDEATAFTGRNAAYWLGAEAMWEDPSLDEVARAWGRTALDDLAPYAAEGRYVNDVSESGRDIARSVYGAAKHERLVALKRAWDPDNVFRLNQNIVP